MSQAMMSLRPASSETLIKRCNRPSRSSRPSRYFDCLCYVEVHVNEPARRLTCEQADALAVGPVVRDVLSSRAKALPVIAPRPLAPGRDWYATRGFDKTLPQWVIELKIEAWAPAEDVRNIYQHVQLGLLAEATPPKTQAHTFMVAQFVWEEELRYGKQPSWPILFNRWKEQNPDDNSFKRGEKATPPRYKDPDELIASESRRLERLKEAWDEGPQFGLRPY
jgi:hypothetical protein